MHSHHQHLFVIRAVEDTDLAALRQTPQRTPQVIVIQFLHRRSLEGIHLAALRIYPRHHVLDDAIFAGRVHGLKNEQHAPTVLGVELVLQIGHRSDAVGQKLLRVFLGMYFPSVFRIEILQTELASVLDPIRLDQLARPTHINLPVNR